MLVLSRKKGETVLIDGGIEVTVCEIRGDKVRLGFLAPREIGIVRKEVKERAEAEASKEGGETHSSEG